MHAIETMAYVGQEPWHGLGTKVSPEAQRDYMRFMMEAGLDWQVTKVPLVTADVLSQDMSAFAYATRRTSDSSILGSVGPRYEILQNIDAFQWFEPFITSGECLFETAGSLFSGARVWILAKLNREPMEIVTGDKVEKFLLLSHAHDGSLSINAGLTPIRVVCNNTLSMALRNSLFKARHTQNLQTKLEVIRETVAKADEAFSKVAESYRFLASRQAMDSHLEIYSRRVMGMKEEGELSTKAKNIIQDILGRIRNGKGQDLAGVRGSWWAAYNGITEYLSHERGHNQETRLNALWFGDSAQKNQDALEMALEMAA